MRQVRDLEPGDVTPWFTVERVVDPLAEDPEAAGVVGNGELAVWAVGDHGPRLMAGDRLVPVIGCTQCIGRKRARHANGSCGRRSVAEPGSVEARMFADTVAAEDAGRHG